MLGRIRKCPVAPLGLRRLPSTSASSFRSSSLTIRNEASAPSRTSVQVRAFTKSSFVRQNAATAAAAPASQNQDAPPAYKGEPLTRFKELKEHGLVDPGIIRTLTEHMGLDTMTEVQTRTINEALTGRDVLAQAKTGTGKTIGFLLPIIENVLKEDPSLAREAKHIRRRYRPSDIKAIIISPTRELAEQIAAEARKLTRGTSIVVQTGVGGTQKRMHLSAMRSQGCHILVGTPGRLKDILSDPSSGVTAPGLNTLVLDEADRLLDQGFGPEIQEIQDLLPRRDEKDRQTLMFSATVPREIVGLARSLMKPDVHYVQTVQEDETPTAMRVTQKLVVVPGIEHSLPAVLELCDRELQASAHRHGGSAKPFKAIVYFPTTMETEVGGGLFLGVKRPSWDEETPNCKALNLRDTFIYNIHSRLSQAQRTAAAASFRNATSAILMSSDVTSRGMDFPNVTHVIQVGTPENRDTYIHRIGRTARAGEEGEGWLIIPNSEVDDARRKLRGLPVKRDGSLETTLTSFEDQKANEEPMTDRAKTYFLALQEAAKSVHPEKFHTTYRAMLNKVVKADKPREVVAQMNNMARIQWGLAKPPSVSPMLANKLGIARVPGVNIGMDEDFNDGPPGRRPMNPGFGRREQPDFEPRGTYQPRNDRRDFQRRGSDREFDRRPSFGGRGGFEGRPSFGGRGRSDGRPSFGGRGGFNRDDRRSSF